MYRTGTLEREHVLTHTRIRGQWTLLITQDTAWKRLDSISTGEYQHVGKIGKVLKVGKLVPLELSATNTIRCMNICASLQDQQRINFLLGLLSMTKSGLGATILNANVGGLPDIENLNCIQYQNFRRRCYFARQGRRVYNLISNF